MSLLRAWFYCETNQFTDNHAAIAFLLAQSIVPFVLTTNFDNAIESAFGSSNGRRVDTYIHTSAQVQPQRGALVKLHGDVDKGTNAATPRQFLSSQRLGEHGYIRAIVRGRTVLVTGYSGTGDVDILRHLQGRA